VIEPRLFLCSGAKVGSNDPIADGRKSVELDSIGSKANVNIRFENVARVFGGQLSPRLVDLLEIASYVFSADCATRRGTEWSDNDSTEPWNRDFAFVIPVRDLAFWSSEAIQSLIVEVLTFLSDDRYSFSFVSLKRERPYQQQYLEFGSFNEWPFHAPERVVMFSGGLDSLAGAVETAKRGQNTVLVSHRPVSTMSARQSKLFKELARSFPQRFLHVPVWINKKERLGQEPTQRTRSFLFAALGAVVAESINAGGLRFFENGVVSLNLPVADEVLRSRASRTTHPITLHLLQSLCAAVAKREFVIDNPYFYKTKSEVVEVLSGAGVPHLISHTCSCAHSMFKAKSQWHCGRCSQCIDRRFAVSAAGLQRFDAKDDYESDVFLGARKNGPEKNMAADYVRHGLELCQRSERDLATQFSAETSRAVRHEGNRSEAASKIIAMHRRHGETVGRVLTETIAEKAADLAKGTVAETSLLSMVIRKEYLNRGVVPAIQPSNLTYSGIKDVLRDVLSEIGASNWKRRTSARKKPKRRDTVIYAAIMLELRGLDYCCFLHNHGLKPKWFESGPSTYTKSYEVGRTWRKRLQDEKSRAGARLKMYPESELREALATHMPQEFQAITQRLNSRNSRSASAVVSRPVHA
jgi:7-cyano-7-deazaguanine synthase in queuosine biosynthesis